MLTTFRKFQKGTLIVVTIVVVIAFAFLYSDFDFSSGKVGSSDCVIKVYNRCYRVEEAQKLARFQNLAMNLGMGEFTRTLMGPNRLDNDPTNFVMNMLVLRKEAGKLGIEPSATEIKAAIPNLPIFQQLPWANGTFIRNLLGQLGLDEGDLAQLVKDYLSYNQLQELIGGGLQAVPSEIDKSYIQRNQRFTASLINFDRSDFEKDADVSDEEAQKYFDERNTPAPAAFPERTPDFAEDPDAMDRAPQPVPQPDKERLMTAPMRGFDYAKFIPEKLAETATQEEKAKSGIAFAKQVNRIYSELATAGAGFDTITKAWSEKEKSFTMKIGKFKPFKQDEAPEEIKADQALLSAIFSDTLRKEEVSVPYSGEEGSYYVFKYSELVEPREMTFEEAKPLITKALKAKKSNQLASDAANAALAKLQEVIDQKKSIQDAASANKLNLVTLPNFSEVERPEVEDSGMILASVRETGPGELSKVMERPGGKGYFITYVDKIEIYKDSNKDTNLRNLAASAERQEKTDLFLAWINNRARFSGSARNDSIMNYPSR